MLFETPPLVEPEHRVLSEIDDLKAKLRMHLREPRRWYGSLRRLSFARAIQGSNSIEGFDAALDDAAAVAVGEDPLDASGETTLALAGYRDAMTYVLQIASDAEFSHSTQLLKSLHFMMTGYSLKNRPGQWRAGSIYVNKEATGEIVYEGPALEQVPTLMRELVDQLNAAVQIVSVDPASLIVHAAMAHLNLVMIHPFRDGNGRMARCLQSLMLARGGVISPVFASIEEYLGHNTEVYYNVLSEVGKGGWHPANDARPWLRFNLTAHLRQARTMLRRVKEAERLWYELESLISQHGVPERTINALFNASQRLRVRNSTYRAAVNEAGDEIAEPTASKDLADLVRAELLVPHGKARGRYYTAGPALVELRRAMTSSRDPRDDSDPFAVLGS
jgi:Fic family protein